MNISEPKSWFSSLGNYLPFNNITNDEIKNLQKELKDLEKQKKDLEDYIKLIPPDQTGKVDNIRTNQENMIPEIKKKIEDKKKELENANTKEKLKIEKIRIEKELESFKQQISGVVDPSKKMELEDKIRNKDTELTNVTNKVTEIETTEEKNKIKIKILAFKQKLVIVENQIKYTETKKLLKQKENFEKEKEGIETDLNIELGKLTSIEQLKINLEFANKQLIKENGKLEKYTKNDESKEKKEQEEKIEKIKKEIANTTTELDNKIANTTTELYKGGKKSRRTKAKKTSKKVKKNCRNKTNRK
jgi:hypothetical protein